MQAATWTPWCLASELQPFLASATSARSQVGPAKAARELLLRSTGAWRWACHLWSFYQPNAGRGTARRRHRGAPRGGHGVCEHHCQHRAPGGVPRRARMALGRAGPPACLDLSRPRTHAGVAAWGSGQQEHWRRLFAGACMLPARRGGQSLALHPSPRGACLLRCGSCLDSLASAAASSRRGSRCCSARSAAPHVRGWWQRRRQAPNAQLARGCVALHTVSSPCRYACSDTQQHGGAAGHRRGNQGDGRWRAGVVCHHSGARVEAGRTPRPAQRALHTHGVAARRQRSSAAGGW